ncbi:YeeE/YedE family protein [Dongia sp.]|uniref:YeeE/YedE family protein n=1 Tax=Dongia sp. TaxID=1977262 RepID=UPI0035AF4FAF
MDWNAFDPQRALIGGILIGLAAVMLMIRLGRIAGVSGILANAATQSGEERNWRLAFLIGIVLGAYAMAESIGGFMPIFAGGWPLLILGGLLVGYGTRMGSGCTSGHGICGLARFSKRSLAATLTFMASAIVTVFVVRHLIGA